MLHQLYFSFLAVITQYSALLTTNSQHSGILAKSGVHHPGYALSIPPKKFLPLMYVMDHSPWLPKIQASFFSNGHSQNQSTSSAVEISNELLYTPPHIYIYPFRSPVIPYFFSIAQP